MKCLFHIIQAQHTAKLPGMSNYTVLCCQYADTWRHNRRQLKMNAMPGFTNQPNTTIPFHTNEGIWIQHASCSRRNSKTRNTIRVSVLWRQADAPPCLQKCAWNSIRNGIFYLKYARLLQSPKTFSSTKLLSFNIFPIMIEGTKTWYNYRICWRTWTRTWWIWTWWSPSTGHTSFSSCRVTSLSWGSTYSQDHIAINVPKIICCRLHPNLIFWVKETKPSICRSIAGFL